MPGNIVFNSADNTFDINTLREFAENHSNSKLLLSNDGNVSIKGVITSRLPGTGGRRLNAAQAFLNTLKKEYGDEITNRLAQDAEFQNLFDGKPLSSRRIRLVLEQAENTLSRFGEIEAGIAALKEQGVDDSRLASLEKMAGDIEKILDKRGTIRFAPGQAYNAFEDNASPYLKKAVDDGLRIIARSFGVEVPEGEQKQFFSRLNITFLNALDKAGITEMSPGSVLGLMDNEALPKIKAKLFEAAACLKMHDTSKASAQKFGGTDFSMILSRMIDNNPNISIELDACDSAEDMSALVAKYKDELAAHEQAYTRIADCTVKWYADFAREVSDKTGLPYDKVLAGFKENPSIYDVARNTLPSALRNRILQQGENITDLDAEFAKGMQGRMNDVLRGLEFSKQINVPDADRKLIVMEQGIKRLHFRKAFGEGLKAVSNHPMLQKPADGTRSPLLSEILNLYKSVTPEGFQDAVMHLEQSYQPIVTAMKKPFDDQGEEYGADEQFSLHDLCIIKLKDQLTKNDLISRDRVEELGNMIEQFRDIPDHARGLIECFRSILLSR